MSAYTWGMIAPTSGEDEDAAEKPLHLLPPEVKRVTSGLQLKDYTTEGVEDGMTRFWPCVDELIAKGAQRVVLAGVPISSQLGRPRVLSLIEETKKRTGLMLDTATEAIIAAFEHLGVKRIAIGTRWADQLNQAMKRYFNEAGIEVVYMNGAGQWAKEAFGMSLEEGIRYAFALGRDAFRNAPEAEALLLPGGAWRPFAVIPFLEEDFGKPVVTNGNSRLWRLVHDGIAPPVQGWGKLMAMG
jgi:maleate isomerase